MRKFTLVSLWSLLVVTAVIARIVSVTPAWAAIDFPTSPTTGQTYAYSGQTYIYNGSAWNTLTLGTNPAITKQVFTANGTYTPSPGMQYAIIECVGGGGAGGGTAAADNTTVRAASGGGGGGYSRAYVTAAQVGASQSVTIGGGGTGSAGAAGNNGSDTSVGTLCVGKGGTGGPIFSTAGSAGGAGGVAGTGDFTPTGAPGGHQFYATITTVQTQGGEGGNGPWGGGGKGGVSLNTCVTGGAATNYGGGGGGGICIATNSTSTGGAGKDGVVIITEFLASSWGASVLATNPGSGIYNVGFSLSANASALTIALKTASGADPTTGTPVIIPFNDATGTSTSPASHTLQVTAATSLVVSSGSTLGVTSSQAFRLWIEGCDDSGTFRLGVFNASDSTHIYPLAEEQTQSSTAEGGAGAADSAGVLYTGTAVTTKNCRILGYAEWSSSGLTAGTWTTTNLTRVRVFGPGVHKPGDIIQTVVGTGTPSDTTSSTTFVASSSTLSITPTSAANLVAATVAGQTQGSGGAQGICQLSRGNTANTNMIGNISSAGIAGAAVNQNSPITLMALDKPNTASSQTYAAQFRTDNGANAASWGNSRTVLMQLQEIMG